MAGGWCMDNAIDTNPESLSINLDKMYEGNMKSSILALSIASKYFSPIMENQDNDNKINNDINQEKKRGLLVLTGAKAALKSTPSMLTYGMTKAAVIHLIRSQSDSSPSTKNSKFKTIGINLSLLFFFSFSFINFSIHSIPFFSFFQFKIGILPEVLDTDSNRHSMPTADKGTWTPLDRVVDLLVGWRDDCNLPSGTLVQIVTRKGDTVCTPLLS